MRKHSLSQAAEAEAEFFHSQRGRKLLAAARARDRAAAESAAAAAAVVPPPDYGRLEVGAYLVRTRSL